MKAFLTYILTLLVVLLCLDAHSQVSTAPTGPVTYLQTDLTGNVVLATDAAGNTVWDERYLPYGAKRLGAAGGTGGVDSSTQKYGFQDKALDPETGLQYVGARYYDPLSGRFSGMDPAASPNATIYTFNRYGFANNNPYRYGDRDGKNPAVEYTLVYAAATALGAAVLGEWIGGQFYEAVHSDSHSRKPPKAPSMAGAAISTPAGPGQNPNPGGDDEDREPANLPFLNGDLIEREFETSQGKVDLLAEAEIRGRTLHLKDIAIYPRSPEALDLGTREVVALRSQLAREARALGFDRLRISGLRYSGANPGKEVDVMIDLTRLPK